MRLMLKRCTAVTALAWPSGRPRAGARRRWFGRERERYGVQCGAKLLIRGFSTAGCAAAPVEALLIASILERPQAIFAMTVGVRMPKSRLAHTLPADHQKLDKPGRRLRMNV